MYLLKKSQNLLVSVEDFAFVFSATDDLEQKVKSSLLLVEKDFQGTFWISGHSYSSQKPLYTSVFARFSPEVEAVHEIPLQPQDMKLLESWQSFGDGWHSHATRA